MTEGADNLRLENQYWDRYRQRFAWTAVICGVIFALLDAGGPLAILRVFFGGSDAQWAYATGRWILVGGVVWGGLVNLIVAAPGKAYIVDDTKRGSDDSS